MVPLEDADARIEIIGGQVRLGHGHGQRLVTEPHLHAAYVDAALDQPRSAGVWLAPTSSIKQKGPGFCPGPLFFRSTDQNVNWVRR